MEIVFDIKKKHLIFFSIFLVLVGSVFVAATSWEPWDASKPSHEILYTNMIGPKNTEIIPLELIEKKAVLDAMKSLSGNKSEAARKLGITRKTLSKKLIITDLGERV